MVKGNIVQPMVKGNIVQPQNVKWYQISGNIEDNKDLVDYVKNSQGDYSEGIKKEANTRFNNDQDLLTKIKDEESKREVADRNLSSTISNEIAERRASDSAFTSAIANEKSTREGEINILSNEVEKKANKTAIPTNLSQLENDKGYTTQVWVESKGYLTQHQDISDKANIYYVDTKVANVEAKIPEVPTKVSQLENDRGYITNVSIDAKLNSDIFYEHANNSNIHTTLEEKQRWDSKIYEHANNSNIHTTLEEKQRWDSKIDASALPTKVSQLENDEGYLTEHQDISDKADVVYVDNEILGVKALIPAVDQFITRSVDDLTNYYLKSETYTQQEVRDLIGHVQGISFEIVDELPLIGDKNKIYLVPSGGDHPNVYDEYIYVKDEWELIGSTAVDLSNYYTKQQIDAKGYLTSHQDISHLATKSALNNHLENTSIHVSASEKYAWNNKSNFSGVYSDLLGKPYLFSGNYNDLTNKPTLFSGKYADLSGKPTLFSGKYADLSGKPTQLSQFTDNLGSNPTHTHSQYAQSANLGAAAFSNSYNDLDNKPQLVYYNGSGDQQLYTNSAKTTKLNPVTQISAVTGLQDILNALTSGKQDNLSVGDNLSLVNNLLTLVGVALSAQGLKLVKCTQAEYDAMSSHDGNTVYFITE